MFCSIWFGIYIAFFDECLVIVSWPCNHTYWVLADTLKHWACLGNHKHNIGGQITGYQMTKTLVMVG